jgi:hypothetical protein
MRKSAAISLVLLGASGLAGCDGGEGGKEERRDYYRTLDDCKQDWNQQCEPSNVAGHGGMGPRYWYWLGRMSGDSGAAYHPGGSHAVRSAPTGVHGPSPGFRSSGSSFSRGGFGSTGRSFGGSGS